MNGNGKEPKLTYLDKRAIAHIQGRLKNICGAEKLDGSICTNPAGMFTQHPGEGRCGRHTATLGGIKESDIGVFDIPAIKERMERYIQDPAIMSLDREIALLRAYLELCQVQVETLRVEQALGIAPHQSVVNVGELTDYINSTTSNISKIVERKHNIEVGRKYVIDVRIVQDVFAKVVSVIDQHITDPDAREKILIGLGSISLPAPDDPKVFEKTK